MKSTKEISELSYHSSKTPFSFKIKNKVIIEKRLMIWKKQAKEDFKYIKKSRCNFGWN
jgi:hypothetical protein